MKIQDNYCNNNLLILEVKQLNKIKKLYYFHALKALWDGQGKIKMYYEMSRVKKQLLGKRSIIFKERLHYRCFTPAHRFKYVSVGMFHHNPHFTVFKKSNFLSFSVGVETEYCPEIGYKSY